MSQQKSESRVKKKFKKKAKKKIIIFSLMASIPVITLLFFIMITASFASTDSLMPKEDPTIAAEYKKIASEIGADWEQMVAYDVVVNENKLDNVDTNKTALNFLIISFKEYQTVYDNEKKQTTEKIVYLITADSEEKINDLLNQNNGGHLVGGSAVEIVKFFKELNGTSKGDKTYEVEVDAKDIKDFEDVLTNEQMEWANVLLSDDIIYKMYDENYEQLPQHVQVESGKFFTHPAPGINHITSPFGWRIDPIRKTKRFHTGVDFAAAGCYGSPVVASADGEVIAIQRKTTSYGNNIRIKHVDEKGNQWETRYCHLSQINVTVGAKVKQGDVIGAIGSTGNSTGPHLHFEIKYHGQFINPMQMLGK